MAQLTDLESFGSKILAAVRVRRSCEPTRYDAKTTESCRCTGRFLCGQVRTDHQVIKRRLLKRLLSQKPVWFQSDKAPSRFLQLVENARIAFEARDNHRHVACVLRRRTNHRRTTDIDLFDRFCARHACASNRFRKWIEIHNHQIDRFDSVLLQ